jgi:general nucleoside transport system permease protein
MFAAMGHDPLAGAARLFHPAAVGFLGAAGGGGEGDAAGADRGRAGALLPSNNWNIGAEGQFLVGAMAGGWLAIATMASPQGPWLLPAMLPAGALGGALFALIPALLKTRFGANEILTSLMLVYVAELLLDWLVRGPWRDPEGFNMPQTVTFEPEATMPLLFEGGRLNLGTPIALLVVLVAAVLVARTLKGFEIRLVGEAPRAARFAGFDEKRLTWTVFAISGALAGLAGVIEAAGTVKPAAALDLAGLRLHRDHRGLPRAAEPGRLPGGGHLPGHHLHRRRERADHAAPAARRDARHPGHAAVLRAGCDTLTGLSRAPVSRESAA